MGVSKCENDSANIQVELSSGEKVSVSKACYTSSMKLKKGDTLFMADKFRGRIFQGLMLEDAIGPVRTSSYPNTFKQRVWEREVAAKSRVTPRLAPEEETQVLFPKVQWKDIGPATAEWEKYLKTSVPTTVVALTTPPPS